MDGDIDMLTADPRHTLAVLSDTPKSLMPKPAGGYPIEKLLSWVHEAQQSFYTWRKDSWEDYEFRDGVAWKAADVQKLQSKGIKALTINRVFPILELVYGHFLTNQLDIEAKGRTFADSELSQVMAEGIQFIIDQNTGHEKQAAAFRDAITAGFGCISTGFNHDPRKEKIALRYHNWHSMWWDPYAPPWFDKEQCRYVFTANWTDLDDLIALFPEFAREIQESAQALSDNSTGATGNSVQDEGSFIEDYKRFLAGNMWTNQERRRVRPVEMWYAVSTPAWFAIMADGRVIDLDQIPSPQGQYQAIQQAREVVQAVVKKTRVAIFLGELLLQDCWSPYVHDEYPFIPYVGYTDRFGFPFGIPRQIKEQSMEVNKRRTMALALLNNRRVIIEEGAVEDETRAYQEANRVDGYIVTKQGKLDRVQIKEMSDLVPAQLGMLQQSEREISEISGSADRLMQQDLRRVAGTALETQYNATQTSAASLMANVKHSNQLLGMQLCSLIQSEWTGEKVLRITDRATGAEKFVQINQAAQGVIKNDITQASFDIVVSSRPATDTVREKNMELLLAAVHKSPPEAVGPLLNLAFELSNFPNKEALLAQIRQATGQTAINDELSAEERKQQEQEQAQRQQQQQEEERQQQQLLAALQQDSIKAKTEEARARAMRALVEAQAVKQRVDQEGFAIGAAAAQQQKALQQRQETVQGGTNNDTAAGGSVRSEGGATLPQSPRAAQQPQFQNVESGQGQQSGPEIPRELRPDFP